MCGRFALIKADLEYVAWMKSIMKERPKHPKTHYNYVRSQQAPVIRVVDGEAVFDTLEWNFYESWFEQVQRGPQFNARGETVATNGLFRRSFANRRCIIPMSAWYEWQEQNGGEDSLPYAFRYKDQRTFSVAGIWTTGSKKRPGGSLAIITTRANPACKSIHKRMPVVLNKKDWAAWLDPKFNNVPKLKRLVIPYEGKNLKIYRVSSYVGNWRNDGPTCLKPLTKPEAKQLSLGIS